MLGTGDFNGDGTDDILFQDANFNVVDWLMQDGHVIGGGQITGAGSTVGFNVVGTRDYNGDGISDILFQDSNNNVMTWLRQNDNTVAAGGGLVNGALNDLAGTSWRVVAEA